MIRLSVQESVPKIVGYRANKKEDKAMILKNFKDTGELKEYIRNFINQSKSFTPTERKSLIIPYGKPVDAKRRTCLRYCSYIQQ
jgi:hypothetical protein